jgi:SAM-dependent methyltransferase
MTLAAVAVDAAPGYAGMDTRDALRHEMMETAFARLLDAQLPRPARVLVAGCGSGQLCNFLGLSWGRTVIGVDDDMPALALAEAWRRRFSVRNASFVAGDMAALPFADTAFDMVIADGVLDRAADALAGVRTLARLVRPGGHLAVGIANRFERLAFWRMSHAQLPITRYSLSAMLTWFEAAGFDCTASLPTIGDRDASPEMSLFESQPAGGTMACLSSEIESLLSDAYGGRCIVVGRRRG